MPFPDLADSYLADGGKRYLNPLGKNVFTQESF